MAPLAGDPEAPAGAGGGAFVFVFVGVAAAPLSALFEDRFFLVGFEGGAAGAGVGAALPVFVPPPAGVSVERRFVGDRLILAVIVHSIKCN